MKHLRKFVREALREATIKEGHIDDLKPYADAAARKLGYKIVRTMDQGTWGAAYSLGSGKVMKITMDEGEFTTAEWLKQFKENPRRMAKIYSTHKVDIPDYVGVIIMEELEPLTEIHKKAFIEFEDLFYGHPDNRGKNELLVSTLDDGYSEEFDQYLKDNTKLQGYTPSMVYAALLDLWDESIGQFKTMLTDVHSENFGLKNGQLAMFDLG